jgi:multiple sugar transport system substrate-binding protein
MTATADQRPTASARHDRRAFLKLLAGGLSLPALAAAACSRGGTGALGGGSRSADGEVTELIIPTNQSPWLEAYKAVAAAYESESGVKITLREFPYDGLRTQLTNAVQSKDHPFDVFQLDEPWTGAFYDRGWVTPIGEVDPSFELDSQTLSYADLLLWNAESRVVGAGGQLMGVPINGNIHLFVYRRDLYDELGLQVPTTWEQALANGREAQQTGVVRYGYVPRAQATLGGQSITYDFMPVFYSYGGKWFVDEGTDWTPAVNSSEAVAAVETYRELAKLGPAEPETVGQAEVIALMQGGQSLQTHVVAAAAADLLDPEKSQVADKLGFAVVPAGPTGEPAPTSGTWTLCIPAGLPRKRAQAAAKFLAWMQEKAAQTRFAAEGGIPTRADVLTSPELPETAQAYSEVILESMPHVRPAIRYAFATPMLEHTEQILADVTAGSGPVKPALDELQSKLTTVVRDAGFLA